MHLFAESVLAFSHHATGMSVQGEKQLDWKTNLTAADAPSMAGTKRGFDQWQ